MLHRETGKVAVVEWQTDGILPWKEQKLKEAEEQNRRGGSGWATSCQGRLGPTRVAQVRRQDREGKNGLGEFGGGKPSSNRAQVEGPKAK